MTIQEEFNEVWGRATAKMDFREYPNKVFIFDGTELIFECYFKNAGRSGLLFSTHSTLYRSVQSKMGGNTFLTTEFLKKEVEKQFNIEENFPWGLISSHNVYCVTKYFFPL
jgi:hypothetical protein